MINRYLLLKLTKDAQTLSALNNNQRKILGF